MLRDNHHEHACVKPRFHLHHDDPYSADKLIETNSARWPILRSVLLLTSIDAIENCRARSRGSATYCCDRGRIHHVIGAALRRTSFVTVGLLGDL